MGKLSVCLSVCPSKLASHSCCSIVFVYFTITEIVLFWDFKQLPLSYGVV